MKIVTPRNSYFPFFYKMSKTTIPETTILFDVLLGPENRLFQFVDIEYWLNGTLFPAQEFDGMCRTSSSVLNLSSDLLN